MRVKERKTSFYVMRSVIISAVAVILVFLLLFLVRGCSSAQATDVEVPDFVGKTIVEVNENNPNNFKFEIKSKYVKNKEIGEILEQDPEPGSKLVKTGSTIEITVNGTDTEVSVPYCKNSSQADAIKAIENKNLTPKVVEIYDGLTPEDYVCDTFPPAGVKTTIGSTVYIYVARGEIEEQFEVPKVTGYNLSAAQSELSENFEVQYIYDDKSLEPAGIVTQQSPLQYSMVDKGTVINLVVSSGKGSETTVNISVDMPITIDEDVEMTVSIDGEVDDSYTTTINPAYNSSYTMSFTGSGSSTVIVMLDGQSYRRYVIDYTTKNYTTTSYTYVHEEETTQEDTHETSDTDNYNPIQVGNGEPMGGEAEE